VIVPHELIAMIRLVLTTHLEEELVWSCSSTYLLAFSTLRPQLLSSTHSESPLRVVRKKTSNLALEEVFVRLEFAVLSLFGLES
jgi:hypothetical protein